MIRTFKETCNSNLSDLRDMYCLDSRAAMASGEASLKFSKSPSKSSLWFKLESEEECPFTYSIIGLALGNVTVAENGTIMGCLTGISIGAVSETEKIWKTSQALGHVEIPTIGGKINEESNKDKHCSDHYILHALWLQSEDLHSRIGVVIHRTNSISKSIEALLDREFQPQLR